MRYDLLTQPAYMSPIPVTLDLYYKTGATNAVTSTNHEIVVHFMGMTKDHVLAAAALRAETGTGDAVAGPVGDRDGCG